MFPGIMVCERQTGLQSPQQNGFSQHSNSVNSSSPNGSSPNNTRLNLAPSSSPDKQQSGDQSPRGPLSVDLSEGETSRSGTVDDELARTFDLRDLESAE